MSKAWDLDRPELASPAGNFSRCVDLGRELQAALENAGRCLMLSLKDPGLKTVYVEMATQAAAECIVYQRELDELQRQIRAAGNEIPDAARWPAGDRFRPGGPQPSV